jgi:hypothetical protein
MVYAQSPAYNSNPEIPLARGVRLICSRPVTAGMAVSGVPHFFTEYLRTLTSPSVSLLWMTLLKQPME